MGFGSARLVVGTQVVLRAAGAGADGRVVRRGATGRVVTELPDGRYVVRLADGRELPASRSQLALRTAYQREIAVPKRVDGAESVREHTIYAARMDGLGTEVDRGVYVAPTEAFWSLTKPPRYVEEPGRCFWEVERFCELSLEADPDLLEVLHSPMVVTRTELGDELVELRPAFLSQLIYQTYSAYVRSRFRKVESDLRRHGVPKWKHVVHLLRLLLTARGLLRAGEPGTDASEERLRRVSRGEYPWAEVESWRVGLEAELDAALDHTPLKPGPDVDRVDSWLRSVRRRSLG